MTQALSFRCAACGGINRVAPERLASGPRCGRCQQPLDLDNPPAELSDDALDQLIRGAPVPVLVDFWAPWCGPCRAVAPHIQQLARQHAGKLLVAKVNTDVHGRTAAALQVRGIPTLAIWKGGKLLKSEAGARMGPQLEAFVAPFL